MKLYKKAQVLTAQKNGVARIICPYCMDKYVIDCKSFDVPFNNKCDCGNTYRVDIPCLVSKIHWAYKWPDDWSEFPDQIK